MKNIKINKKQIKGLRTNHIDDKLIKAHLKQITHK